MSSSNRLPLLAAGLLLGACAGGADVSPAQPEERELVARALEPQVVDDFALLDHRGRHHELYAQDDARAVVLVSYQVGCPILRWTLPRLEQLAQRYGERGVRFFYVDASPQDTRDDLAHEAEQFGLEVPILHDEAQLVLPHLDAERTAEAFVIDPRSWSLVYRGRIDDAATYGGQSARPTETWLRDALESFLAGEEVAVPRTRAEGCLIHYGARVEAAVPDYVGHVAPILINRCVSCHSEGGVAPWSMSSWQRVRGWSPMIREAVMTRRMPPWHADPHWGEFSNDRGLTPDERSALVRWVEAGAPRGEGPDPLPEASSPERDTAWPLGPPDLVLQSKGQEIPATGIVPYRYERAPIDIEEDIWVRGADLRPSNPAVLHHSVILVMYPEHLKHLQPVYQQGVGSYFALYIPGMRSRLFPEGTGKLIPAGSKVIFQYHYTTTGKPEVDRPELALYLCDEPPPVQFESTSAIKWDFDIAPGDPAYYAEAEERFDRDVMLCRMTPHMHYRGRSIRYEAHLPDGTVETLLSVPNYDFNWQTSYELDPPRFLPAGTTIVCSGWYDNSERNPFNPDPTQRVIWGPQSSDEMFIGYMDYYAVPSGAGSGQ